MMRGHDRQLSNIENMPQGFQQLQRIYSELEESAAEPEGAKPMTKVSSEPIKKVTRSPFPNPWARKETAAKKTDPPKEENVSYEEKLQLMQEMGFPDGEANLNALKQTGGDVQAAVELLLRQMK